MDKIYVLIYLVPLLWRNNFDLKPKKNTDQFKISSWAWPSLIVWTTTYACAMPLALYYAWFNTPGFVAGIGWLVLFSGIIIRRLAYKEIGIHYHPSIAVREQHQIIDVGIYRYLRHPLHLGLFLEIAGWSMMSESSVGLGLALAALVTTLMRNIVEEKFLKQQVGAYAAYCERTWDITKPWKLK